MGGLDVLTRAKAGLRGRERLAKEEQGGRGNEQKVGRVCPSFYRKMFSWRSRLVSQNIVHLQEGYRNDNILVHMSFLIRLDCCNKKL